MAALIGASCAPIEATRVRDETLRTKTVTAAGGEATITAVGHTDEEGGSIVVQSHQTCMQHVEELHRRTRFTERHSDSTTLISLYGLGGLGAVLGGVVILDASNVPDSRDPMTTNPVGRSGAYAIGTGLLVVGGGLLATAVGTSLRAHDRVEKLGTAWVKRDDSVSGIECHVRPAAGAETRLVAGNGKRTQLGRTSKTGRLTFTWLSMGEILDVDSPPATASIQVAGGVVAGEVDLAAGKTFWARREVDEAQRLASMDKVDDASVHLVKAAALGADVTEARRAIANAPTSLARARAAEEKERAEVFAKQRKAEEHLARAREFVRRKRLDEADGELVSARTLGADTDALSSQVLAFRAEQTIARWKKHVSQCRKLSAIREKLRAVSRCDEECQKVSRRVDRDWDELGREKLELSGIGEEQGQALREMCEQAGCPECPQ